MSVFSTKNAARTSQPAFKTESAISDLATLPQSKLGIVPVPNADFIYDYTLMNPNVTAWGITFNETTTPVRNIAYQIWFNASNVANGTDVYGREVLSFMRGIDEAISKYSCDRDNRGGLWGERTSDLAKVQWRGGNESI